MDAGILHPHLNYKFRVEFLDSTAFKPIPENDALAKQLVRISPLDPTPGANGGEFTIGFEDDITNFMFNKVHELAKRTKFVIKIDRTDGNDQIIRTHYVKSCSVTKIMYGALDYSARSASSTVDVVFSYKSVATT